MGADWNLWRKITGILCCMKVPVKIKAMIFTVVVRMVINDVWTGDSSDDKDTGETARSSRNYAAKVFPRERVTRLGMSTHRRHIESGHVLMLDSRG